MQIVNTNISSRLTLHSTASSWWPGPAAPWGCRWHLWCSFSWPSCSLCRGCLSPSPLSYSPWCCCCFPPLAVWIVTNQYPLNWQIVQLREILLKYWIWISFKQTRNESKKLRKDISDNCRTFRIGSVWPIIWCIDLKRMIFTQNWALNTCFYCWFLSIYSFIHYNQYLTFFSNK